MSRIQFVRLFRPTWEEVTIDWGILTHFFKSVPLDVLKFWNCRLCVWNTSLFHWFEFRICLYSCKPNKWFIIQFKSTHFCPQHAVTMTRCCDVQVVEMWKTMLDFELIVKRWRSSYQWCTYHEKALKILPWENENKQTSLKSEFSLRSTQPKIFLRWKERLLRRLISSRLN